jgi:competence protein ComEA
MKKNKNYFSYSNREHKSYLVVSAIIIIFIFSRLAIAYLPQKPEKPDQKAIALLKKLQQPVTFDKELNHDEPLDFTSDYIHDQTVMTQRQLFVFDPNSIDSVRMLELGLNKKQVKTICNYRRKGGKFFKPIDLKKMYCINLETYQKLAPYIKIDSMLLFKNYLSKKGATSLKNAHQSKTENLVIEINDADTVSIQLMKGVGSKLARRIFNYRERLGGFIRKNQLLEVYGIDSNIYKQMESQLIIDTSSLRKININKVYFDNIKLFPYLSRNQAIALINYRNRHGNFSRLDEIKKCVLIDDETYKKVKDYFVLNE